jgi:hypothetical protein
MNYYKARTLAYYDTEIFHLLVWNHELYCWKAYLVVTQHRQQIREGCEDNYSVSGWWVYYFRLKQ